MAAGKLKKWRENHDHVVILPFAIAVNGLNVMLNVSSTHQYADDQE